MHCLDFKWKEESGYCGIGLEANSIGVNISTVLRTKQCYY